MLGNTNKNTRKRFIQGFFNCGFYFCVSFFFRFFYFRLATFITRVPAFFVFFKIRIKSVILRYNVERLIIIRIFHIMFVLVKVLRVTGFLFKKSNTGFFLKFQRLFLALSSDKDFVKKDSFINSVSGKDLIIREKRSLKGIILF